MILLDLPISREYFLSMFQACNVRPDIAEHTSDLSVVRSLVANGFGFGLVNMRTRSEIAPDGEALAFLEIKDEIRPLVLGLATKQVEYRSRIVSAFFDHARALVTNNALPGVILPR